MGTVMEICYEIPKELKEWMAKVEQRLEAIETEQIDAENTMATPLERALHYVECYARRFPTSGANWVADELREEIESEPKEVAMTRSQMICLITGNLTKTPTTYPALWEKCGIELYVDDRLFDEMLLTLSKEGIIARKPMTNVSSGCEVWGYLAI